MDSNNCWLGNYCQSIESGGCPSTTASGSDDGTSTFTCFEPYYQDCNSTEIACDAGMDSDGCWYGNYCISQVNEWDGCHGVCSLTATGRLRTGATWEPIRTAAGWATGAKIRAWEAAQPPWEAQSLPLVRTSAPT